MVFVKIEVPSQVAKGAVLGNSTAVCFAAAAESGGGLVVLQASVSGVKVAVGDFDGGFWSCSEDDSIVFGTEAAEWVGTSELFVQDPLAWELRSSAASLRR